MIEKIREIRLWLEVALAVAVVIFAVLYLQKLFAPAPVGVAVEARESKALKDVPTEKMECVPVIVYREKAKSKLNLPAAVQEDPNKSVVSAVEVSPDIRPHRITTTLDTTTGEIKAYDTRLSLPWVAISTRGEAGIAYGYRGGDPAIRIEIRQALIDVKAIRVGVVASRDQPTSGGEGASYVGVSAAYRW